MKREKTKHKGIYKVGDDYYVTFYDGTMKQSKAGVPYPAKHEKRIGPRLAAALKFKTDMEGKVGRGMYSTIHRQETTTFNELLDLYDKEGDGKSYILQFRDTYRDCFGTRKLSLITRKDLFAFRDKVKNTPRQRGGAEVTDATVNRALAGLRRLFHFALSREYLESSPFPDWPKSGLFYSEKKGKKRYFKEAQIEEILDEARKPIYPLWARPAILTAYYTGMRTGESELLALKWKWIDFHEGVIRLTRTKTLKDENSRGQEIVMQKELVDLLKSLPVTSEWVFCQPDGERLRQWHFYNCFQKILGAVGIDPEEYSSKEIRHTTGTLMHKKGVPVTAIKDQLRHRTSKTTEDFYIGADHDYQRQMAERLELNSGKIVGRGVISTGETFPNA